MILGLHGRKQSGKDLVYEYLTELLPDKNIVRDAFADRLKLSALRCFKPDATLDEAIDWAEELKFTGGASAWSFVPCSVDEIRNTITVSGREFLQNYGTEAHREVFDQDFWVKQVLPSKLDYDLLVITDVRFPNEAEAIHAEGGKVWLLDRPAVDDGDTHASEKPLDSWHVDYVVKNHGSLTDLKRSVVQGLYQSPLFE